MTDRRQPDRTRGIFETLLVVEGEPVELEAHLDRLAQSLEAVYSRALPPETENELQKAAEGIALGRLRCTVAPVEDGLRIDLLAGGVDPETVFPTRGVKLNSHPLSGGLGTHKWVDRKGINRPAADEAGALILDEAEVLEAGWANVFAVRSGTLFTPPLDGRLLPGTTRAALLQLATEEGIDTCEQPLTSNDLLTAEEVFLTGSIRGIEPVLELDGQPLVGRGALSDRLAGALRQRWGLPNETDAPRAFANAQRPDLPAQ
jgi:para-aminobenzoate synthetase/4-amino-4-deoxychorismate lyase